MNDRGFVHVLSYGIGFEADGLRVTAEHEETGVFLTASITALTRAGEAPLPISAYRFRETVYTGAAAFEARLYTADATVRLLFSADVHGVYLRATDHTGAPVTLTLDGTLGTADDPAKDAFAMAVGRESEGLRAALGPAVSPIDNAVFDRVRGAQALVTDGKGGYPKGFSLAFDFERNAYTFTYEGELLTAELRLGMYRELYGIPYRGINKKNTFPTPPAGWMTWYAVKFDASERVILENAEIMKSKLYDFGANVLWVDWEWQHGALTAEGPRGVDVFHPFTDRYPRGLAYLASELTGMGLTPALWGGFTHEPGECEFIDRHPETVLRDKVLWYGRFTFDPSHPTWREEYLRPAVRNFPAMGYRALKWDCLPSTLSACDQHRERMYNGGHPWRAMREAARIAREELGDDYYMMSCDGSSDRSVLFGADLFDGARISGDIFEWKEFKVAVERLCRFYPLHNAVLYCDPDNVVTREEYNNMEQARTRVSLTALLGLPTTIGDDLRALPDERIELYRRALPPIDAHPMDIREYLPKDDLLTVNLAVAKPFAKWNTVGIFNLSEEERAVTLSLGDDLFLAAGRYHIYDYWKQEYRGLTESSVTLTLPPFGCAVLRVTRDEGVPTVVCTSRHITGGAPDLLAVTRKDGKLTGRSAVVKGDPYTVAVATPEGESRTLTVTPDATGEIEWSLTV